MLWKCDREPERPHGLHPPSMTTKLSYFLDDFWELMDERPVLAQGVITLLAQRLDETMDNLQRLRHV